MPFPHSLPAANTNLPSPDDTPQPAALTPTQVPLHPPPEPLSKRVAEQPPSSARTEPVVEDEHAVTMSIYADNSQDQLVASQPPPEQQAKLIRLLSPRPQH